MRAKLVKSVYNDETKSYTKAESVLENVSSFAAPQEHFGFWSFWCKEGETISLHFMQEYEHERVIIEGTEDDLLPTGHVRDTRYGL